MHHRRTDIRRTLVSPVQGDERGQRRNGYPELRPYIPRGLTPDQLQRFNELHDITTGDGNIRNGGGADLDTHTERSNTSA